MGSLVRRAERGTRPVIPQGDTGSQEKQDRKVQKSVLESLVKRKDQDRYHGDPR